ncbi:MAG: carboxypeptidase regulatory-like domain-containing protein, partial [Saprospiraceae bacterium]
MRSIILLTAFLALYVSASTAQNAYYRVKFPDDATVYGCGAQAAIEYPVIEMYANCSFNVGVSVSDMVFNITQGGGCKKILRTFTLLYWCDYDPNAWPVFIPNPTDSDIGPTLFGQPSNRGHLQYTQVIKVLDAEAPTFIDCPAGPLEFCDLTSNDPAQYNNGHVNLCEGPVSLSAKVTDICSKTDLLLSYRLFLDLDGNGSMETFLSSSAPGAWPIDKTVVGSDTLMGSITFPTGFGLPYGTHKIEWIANDKCGNETICKYEFIVKDCKAPTVLCINGLSVNIMQTGMITLNDIDFIKQYFDNCTPNNQIKIGIRKAGSGTGFPANSNSVTFGCSELGPQSVEVWAEDAYGNADYCLTFVNVQDNMGSCAPPNKLPGKIHTFANKPVPGAQVALLQYNNTLKTAQTDADGKYEMIGLTSGCNYSLAASMNSGASVTAGVNTLDALLTAAHIDGFLPLATPYQLLAADVDKSGSLTPADVLNISKVLLGAQLSFPDKPVWQFVPGAYTFANPSQPWAGTVPSATPTFCMSAAMPLPASNFIGIKTGDVNGSGNTNLQSPEASDRQAESEVFFQTKDKVFAAGDIVRVDITTPDLANLVGFQFTLDFDPAVLALQQVEPDLVSAEFTATPGEGHVTATWHSVAMLDPTVVGKDMYL